MKILAKNLNLVDLDSSVQYTQCPACKNHVQIPYALRTTRNTLNPIMTMRRVSVARATATTTRVPSYVAYNYSISPATTWPWVCRWKLL